jgi:hypothetical protein
MSVPRTRARTTLAEAAKRINYDGLWEELGRIRAIVHSSDGSVAVTAGPNGAVQDVRLSPQALAPARTACEQR